LERGDQLLRSALTLGELLAQPTEPRNGADASSERFLLRLF